MKKILPVLLLCVVLAAVSSCTQNKDQEISSTGAPATERQLESSSGPEPVESPGDTVEVSELLDNSDQEDGLQEDQDLESTGEEDNTSEPGEPLKSPVALTLDQSYHTVVPSFLECTITNNTSGQIRGRWENAVIQKYENGSWNGVPLAGYAKEESNINPGASASFNLFLDREAHKYDDGQYRVYLPQMDLTAEFTIELGEVLVVLEQTSYNEAPDIVPYTIINNTTARIAYSFGARLQHHNGSQWVDVSPPENAASPAILVYLQPGESNEGGYWMDPENITYQPGRYRIYMWEYDIYAEFAIRGSALRMGAVEDSSEQPSP